jgi:hypothetical protein
MRLTPNRIVLLDGRRHRVVAVSPYPPTAFVISLDDPCAVPFELTLDQVVGAPTEPDAQHGPEPSLSTSDQELAMHRWRIIESIADSRCTLTPDSRWRTLCEYSRVAHCTPQYLESLLRLYWQGGQVLASLSCKLP